MSLRDRLRPTPAPRPPTEAEVAKALAAQRGKSTWAPAPTAGKAAAALMRPLQGKASMGLNELTRRWDEIVGPPFSGKTSPEKLAGGVLTLRAPSAVAPFIQQQIPLLVERLKLAGAKVTSIRLEQRAQKVVRSSNVRPLRRGLTAEQEAALAHSLDHVRDPDVKSALLRLGRAVKRG